MPATKRRLDAAELRSYGEKRVAFQHPKRQRVAIPGLAQQSHLQRAQAQSPRSPLRDITPPGSAIEAQEPFPGSQPSPPLASSHRSDGGISGQEPNAQGEALPELIGRLSGAEAKSLLLQYAGSFGPLADAIAALANKGRRTKEESCPRVENAARVPTPQVPALRVTQEIPRFASPSMPMLTEVVHSEQMYRHPGVRSFDHRVQRIRILLYRARRNPGCMSIPQWAVHIAAVIRESTSKITRQAMAHPSRRQDMLNACSALLDIAWAVMTCDVLMCHPLIQAVQNSCSIDGCFEILWSRISRHEQHLLLQRRQWTEVLFEEQIRILVELCEQTMPGFQRCTEPVLTHDPSWKAPAPQRSTVDETFLWAVENVRDAYRRGIRAEDAQMEDLAYEAVWYIRRLLVWICSYAKTHGTWYTRRGALAAVSEIFTFVQIFTTEKFGRLVRKLLQAESLYIAYAFDSLAYAICEDEEEIKAFAEEHCRDSQALGSNILNKLKKYTAPRGPLHNCADGVARLSTAVEACMGSLPRAVF